MFEIEGEKSCIDKAVANIWQNSPYEPNKDPALAPTVNPESLLA